jgi:hypothetical protein
MSTRSGEPHDRGITREETLGKEIRLDRDHDGRDRDHDGRSDHELHTDRDTDRDVDEERGAHPDHADHDRHEDTRVVPAGGTRRDDDDVIERHEVHDAGVDRARGGFSFWSVLSGMFVAFGSFIILSAIIGAIMAATGMAEGGINASEATTAGIAAAVGLVIAQFLAYLWGGYTAGRMARGSGVLNGLMVPIFAIILVAILGGILAAVTGTSPDAAASEAQNQAQSLPLPLNDIAQIGTGVGIGLLVAMLLGGALGGSLGHRWHRKLEDGRTRYTDGDMRHTA